MAEAGRGAAARRRVHGLYGITPGGTDTDPLLEMVGAALAGGMSVLQYRDKSAAPQARAERAKALLALTRAAGALLIVNDDVELALAVGADGVHIGADDGDPGQVRQRIGRGLLLGVSCYNRIDLAERAIRAGADHVAFGSVFASTTKPDAVRADLGLLSQARRRGWNAVAIGGITTGNAGAAIAAGADALAVIQSLFGAGDVRAQAHRFTELFDTHEPERTTV